MKENFLGSQENENLSFPLPIENELLILKLKAEFGAECTTGNQDIPPVVVNEFLKSVYEFEQKFREYRPPVKIFNQIGQPRFIKVSELNDEQVSAELRRLVKVLEHYNIKLDVLGRYADRLIYTFLTEEFFNYEIDYPDIPGYTHHFCYEDFYPNHEMDVRQRIVEFLTQWFDRRMDEYSGGLAADFIHPDGREFRKGEVLRKISNIFDAYPVFSEESFGISSVQFEWNESNDSGKGCAEGWLQYRAVTENNESVWFKGPFQFYVSNNGRWWSIYYFIFPGFNWNE